MPDAVVEVECEHCGQPFTVPAPKTRKVPCPACGARTLVPVQRAPAWWLAVLGAALLAIVIPGLTFRLLGPTIALPVAVVVMAALWFLGRRL